MGKSAFQQISTALIGLLLCLSSGCVSMRPVSADTNGDQIRAEVKSGDTVRVLMMDGTTHSLKVTKVGDSSVSGDAVKMWKGGADAVGTQLDLRYQDIRKIAIRHINVLATVAIVAVVVIATVVGVATGGGRHTPGYNR
ncbi:MAG TPA: hypothetical protein VIY68_15440 [Steroidobacteraceae bacterium]